MKDKSLLIAENVAIILNPEEESSEMAVINNDELLRFMGDITKTIELPIAQSKALSEDEYGEIKLLFGSWVESGDEDRQLEDLYKSRLNPSTSPEE